jgi:hypothetical protein
MSVDMLAPLGEAAVEFAWMLSALGEAQVAVRSPATTANADRILMRANVTIYKEGGRGGDSSDGRQDRLQAPSWPILSRNIVELDFPTPTGNLEAIGDAYTSART